MNEETAIIIIYPIELIKILIHKNLFKLWDYEKITLNKKLTCNINFKI